jgi:hypothetical protein
MTDHPRFQTLTGAPDQRRHSDFHGARQVDALFWLVDRLRRQSRTPCWELAWLPPIGRTIQRRNGKTIIAVAAAALALLLIEPKASAQERIRGTIESLSEGVYSIRTRDAKLVKLRLARTASVAASIKSTLSDIRPGVYIGVAALPQADGTLSALAVHIFDETMRGTVEGHRAWDLLPQSTMTNAVVQEISTAVDGHSVMLRYKNGQQQISIPTGTTIVTYLPGSIAELKPGAIVFVPVAIKQPDGTLETQRVMVGRDVAPPQ